MFREEFYFGFVISYYDFGKEFLFFKSFVFLFIKGLL